MKELLEKFLHYLQLNKKLYIQKIVEKEEK